MAGILSPLVDSQLMETEEQETEVNITGLLGLFEDVVAGANGDDHGSQPESGESDSDDEGSLYVEDDEGMDGFDAE
jgi:hypothetical protein